MSSPAFVFSSRNSWLFSKSIDLGLIWGTLILVVLLANHLDIRGNGNLESLENFLFIKITVDLAHVFATIFPVFSRFKQEGLKLKTIAFYTLFPCVLSFIIYAFSPKFFYYSLALSALSHIFLQQYGLVMVCRAKGGDDARFRWLDTLEFWNIVLVPVIWWLSPLSGMEKSYFLASDLVFLPKAGLATLAHTAHWFLHLIYVMHIFIKERRINIAKLSLLFGTWSWLYLSLVILENFYIFWSCLFLYHGLIYILFSYQDFQTRRLRHLPSPRPSIYHYRSLLFYLIPINALALVWISFYQFHPIHLPLNRTNPFLVIIWWPLLIHYSLDSLIWTKSFKPPELFAKLRRN